ncbi:MAG: hypothetical protein RDV41_00575, partial [Planctomycetota bacterium]|nr:hypothetical protein [Planctomycetota bacterium]
MRRAANARHGTTVQGHVQWPPGRKVKYLRPPWVLLTALAVCLTALVADGPGYAQQAPPNIINFQGRLTDNTGVPVNSTQRDIRLEFFDALSGGTSLGTYTAVDATVTNGVYGIEVTPPASVFANNATVYAEVSIGNGIAGADGSFETLSPRTRLIAAAYALNADSLDGRDSTYFAPASGSNNYVQLAPAAAQTWTTANTGIFLNETGAGSPFLLRLQTGGSDMLVLGNTGNASLAGDLQVMGNDLQDNSGNARVTLGTTVSTPAGVSFTVGENTTLGDAGADTLTFNANTLSVPNNLNIDTDTLFIDATNNRIGIGTNAPTAALDIVNTGGLPGAKIQLTSNWNTSINSDNQLVLSGGEGPYGANWKNIVFQTNSSEKARLDVNGYLGIGTTGPTSMLDVTKNAIGATQADTYGLSLVNTTAAAAGAQQYSPPVRWRGYGWETTGGTSQSVDFRGYVVPVQGTAASGYLTFESSINGAAYSTNRFRIYSSGTVIAAANVQATGDVVAQGSDVYEDGGDLHLSGEDSVYIKMDYNNDDADTRAIIFGKNTTLATAPSAANELMRITEAGLVGIGTQAPATALHVSPASGLTLGLDAATNTAGKMTLVGAGANDFYTEIQTGTQTGNVTYTLPLAAPTLDGYFLVSTTAGGMSWSNILPSGSTLSFANITTGTNTSATMTVDTGASLVPANSGIITATRFTGSGSTTNAVDLATAEVAGTLPLNRGGTNASLTAANGAVVFSNSSSLALSDVPAVAGLALISGDPILDPAPPTWFAPTAGSVLFAGTNGALAQDNANLLWNDATNRLGIGTAAPNEQLELTGNLRMPATSAAAGVVYSDANTFIHNYGTESTFIGTGAGNLTISGTGRNTGVGYRALNATTTGYDNTAVGDGALNSNTAAASNVAVGYRAMFAQAFANGGTAWSTRNTAVGVEALTSNQPTATTDGLSNTAVGYQALYGNTLGAYSTGMGDYALRNNTTAGYNVAIGYRALATQSYNNGGAVWSAYNTAVGANAMYSNQPTGTGNGVYNSALGYASMYSNTTGTASAAVGYGAMYSNTTGSSNTAMGYYAARYNVTGTGNTIIGREAGYGVAANSYSSNTAVGYRAGYALSTGSNNVLVGYQAGDNLTTGGANVVIGYNVDAPVATTSNQMTIGNLIFGTGVDGTGTTISTGNVGIATASPGYRLDVNGAIRTGVDGLDGQLRIYSEQGAPDYEVVFQPAAAMTQSTTYTLPTAYAAADGYFLTSTIGGVMSWTSNVPGSDSDYIWNQSGGDQAASYRISGTGRANTSFQSPVYTRADAGTVAVRPNTDSMTAIQMQNAAGTSVLNIDTTNQRVGIGTTSPSQMLVVNGNIRIEGSNNIYKDGSQALGLYDGTNITIALSSGGNFVYYPFKMMNLGTAAAPVYTWNGDDNTGLFSPGADTVALSTAGASRLHITSAGDIGVGTTSPTTKIDATGGLRLQQSGGGNAAASLIELGNRTPTWSCGINFNAYYDAGSIWRYRSTDYAASIGFDSAGSLCFDVMSSGTAGNALTFTRRMTILNGGNVGIGDQSPVSLFTVGNGDLFQVDTAGDIVKLKNLTYSWPGSHTTNGVLLNNGSGGLSWSTIGAATITPDSLDFTEFQDILDLDASTELNLGAFNFTVDLDSTGDFIVTDAGAGTHIFRDDGLVGIGTTTPSERLHVNGNLYMQGNVISSASGNTIGTSANYFGGVYSTIYYDANNTAYYLDPANAGTAALIAGSVGIGNTVAPRSALDTWTGTMSGAANDYEKAQFTMSGGGTVSWGVIANRLKWTARFIAIPVQRPNTASVGYVDIVQPVIDIPAGQVYDGLARSATVDGVLLNAWEALYAAHTVGGNNTAITYYIVRYTNNFNPPSNWLLVASINGDNSTAKLGTGITLKNGGTWSGGVDDQYVLVAGDTMTGALSITAAGTGLSVTNNATIGGTLGVTSTGTFGSYLYTSASAGANDGLYFSGTAATSSRVGTIWGSATGRVYLVSDSAGTNEGVYLGRFDGTTHSNAPAIWLYGTNIYGNSSTISSMTWNGATIGAGYGGTGQNSSGWTGLAKVSAGTWSTATGGTDYEYPLTFTNGLTRTTNDIHLGGSLEGATTITNGTASNLVINLSSTGDFDVQDNGTSALFVRDDGNIGIGTSAPDTKLEIAGSSMHSGGSLSYYRDVAHYSTSGNPDTGTLKIAMPKTWSNTMMQVRIQGYQYQGNVGAWEVIVSGYNYATTPAWVNYTAVINGSAPFTQVRLAHDGTYNVILLG